MTKKMKIILGLVVAAGVVAGAISYKNANTSSPEIQEVEEAEKLNPVGPAFNADSALAYCAAQCDFGPRVMNSEAHDKCGEWIVSKFKQFGCLKNCHSFQNLWDFQQRLLPILIILLIMIQLNRRKTWLVSVLNVQTMEITWII